MTIINNNLINPNLVNKVKKSEPTVNYKINEKEETFKQILKNKEESNNIMFSKHAYMRLNSRNLSLSNSQIKRVEDGIKRAEAKGIKDSLVLVDNIALLVNIKNKTVVTAIDNNSEKVYTNIDGAVIV
ncbi:TIGR02530 family flagellar biosynthesis protein [[Clostridium] colinum]|uniref:TIGR02530 family flagellar biosynthesis protein n=1 Tax=[Clostridium] colinum TaxID=36835 RepID=UPI002024DF2A|nr:TIGR02530 family flagellar biosynthesis protein [[Clostridium] colinum]